MGLGSFALATSAIGWFAPGLGPRLVAVYLGTSGLLAFLQVILVLGIFGAQQKVASAIAQADTTGRYTECGLPPITTALPGVAAVLVLESMLQLCYCRGGAAAG